MSICKDFTFAWTSLEQLREANDQNNTPKLRFVFFSMINDSFDVSVESKNDNSNETLNFELSVIFIYSIVYIIKPV